MAAGTRRSAARSGRGPPPRELVPSAELHARPAHSSPAARSAASIASHPDCVTTGTPRSASSASIADASRPARACRPRVLEQELDGLGRVLLVRPDHARRPALDPAGAVDTPRRRPVGAEHAAGLVGKRAGALVERNTGERHAAVPDAPEDDPALDELALVRRHCPAPDELVLDELDRLDPSVAEDRDG